MQGNITRYHFFRPQIVEDRTPIKKKKTLITPVRSINWHDISGEHNEKLFIKILNIKKIKWTCSLQRRSTLGVYLEEKIRQSMYEDVCLPQCCS